VLIKVERSPVNPSDQSYLMGTYNSAQRDPLPCKIGFECSGVVVQSGGGVFSGLRVGQRVAGISKRAGCMWAEYAAVPALQTIPLPDDVSFEEGCSVFVNPFTAVAFLEIAQQGRHRSVIMTAAASALGRMVLRLFRSHGIKVITIVRSAKDRQLLEQLGSAGVIITADAGWEEQLKQLATDLDCRLAFDAVAGELPGIVLAQMPRASTIYVYGGLSKQPCGRIRPTELLFKQSSIKGFWLTPYLNAKSLLGLLKMKNKVVAALKTDLRSDFGNCYSLHEVPTAVARSSPDQGKSIIQPSLPLSASSNRL
jgi:NADPH:quinone reductase-like Zn-dependent oxidoreductase